MTSRRRFFGAICSVPVALVSPPVEPVIRWDPRGLRRAIEAMRTCNEKSLALIQRLSVARRVRSRRRVLSAGRFL
jgi:hypothetical protein